MIVIGTAVDPDMGGELRVTVVATGLNKPGHEAPRPVVRNVTMQPLLPPVTVAGAEPGALPDYRELERPAVLRRAARAQPRPAEEPCADRLNLPAFMRTQAD